MHALVSEENRLPEVCATLPMPMTGIILCGGKSSRMGREKAFLPYAGQTLIEHRIASFRQLFAEVFLVTNVPEQFSQLKVDVVKDILPNRGPLVGILSGLLVSQYDQCFVVACDMPFVDKNLICHMTARRGEEDVLVLEHEQGLEPLLGIYSKACIHPIEEAIFAGNVKTYDFLQGIKAETYKYRARNINKQKLPAYFNVNTPGDYSSVLLQTTSL